MFGRFKLPQHVQILQREIVFGAGEPLCEVRIDGPARGKRYVGRPSADRVCEGSGIEELAVTGAREDPEIPGPLREGVDQNEPVDDVRTFERSLHAEKRASAM